MKLLKWPLAVLIGLLLLGLSPILLPALLAYLLISGAGFRRVANETKCTDCGHLLGREAIRKSDAEWTVSMRDFRDGPEARQMQAMRNHHAICPGCAKPYYYSQTEKKFIPSAGVMLDP